MITENEIRTLYGKTAQIRQTQGYWLVSLDNPSEADLNERSANFNPDQYFCEDCPLCQLLKQGGVVVFD